jgi:hypothetical protein
LESQALEAAEVMGVGTVAVAVGSTHGSEGVHGEQVRAYHTDGEMQIGNGFGKRVNNKVNLACTVIHQWLSEFVTQYWFSIYYTRGTFRA